MTTSDLSSSDFDWSAYERRQEERRAERLLRQAESMRDQNLASLELQQRLRKQARAKKLLKWQEARIIKGDQRERY